MQWSFGEIRRLLRLSEREVYQPGQFLFHEGEVGEHLLRIESGTLEILSESTMPPRRVALRSKGEIIGEMALLDDGIRAAGARAVTRVVLRSLHKKAFDALLEEHPELTLRVTKLLSQRMRLMQQDLTSTPAAPTDTPQLGHSFGPYLLLSELGRGGAGVVYQVLDQKRDKMLALKLIPDADAETRTRFQAECEAIAALDHPAVVKMEAHGEMGRYLFLAMELLHGETLDSRLREGPLSVGEVREWFVPVSDALSHAHERKLAHRDVKPANIFRCSDGRIKLLDFGLARHESAAHITQTGQFFGTAHYFAPERIGGQQNVGALEERAADQYSLGASLYKAVAGRPPFQDADPLIVLMHHLKTEPARPSTYHPVPEMLEGIVMRMLAKAPEDRFASMADVVEALGGLPLEEKRSPLADEPTMQF